MNKVKVTVDDMRAICPACADKMVAKGMKHFYADTTKEDLGLEMTVDSGVSDRLRQFAADNGTQTIKGMEIFAVGDWNGDAYSSKDIDGIVQAFKETAGLLKPYLKIGHSDGQALLAADEMPAAGWFTNIYRQGNKVLGDLVDIPSKIADLIKRRAYKRVSSELFVNIDIGGKTYPYALKAVALLGGETPAVQTLDDIHALYALDQTVLAYHKQAEVRAYSIPAQTEQEATMPDPIVPPAPASAEAPEKKELAFNPGAQGGMRPQPGMQPNPGMGGGAPDQCMQQLQACHAELQQLKSQMGGMMPHSEHTAKVAEFTAKIDALTAELSSSKGELAKVFAAKAEAEVTAEVEKYVSDKKVLPSQAALLKTILLAAKGSEVKKFKIGEKDFDSTEALVREFISLGSGGLPTEPVSESGKANVTPSLQDTDALDGAVREFMKKTGEKSYTKAYTAVVSDLKGKNPEGKAEGDKA